MTLTGASTREADLSPQFNQLVKDLFTTFFTCDGASRTLAAELEEVLKTKKLHAWCRRAHYVRQSKTELRREKSRYLHHRILKVHLDEMIIQHKTGGDTCEAMAVPQRLSEQHVNHDHGPRRAAIL